MATEGDNLTGLLSRRQTCPLNDCCRLQVIDRFVFGQTVAGHSGVLVHESVRFLRADQDQDEGAGEKEDKEDCHEDASTETLRRRVLPVLPDNVCGLRSTLNVDLELAQPRPEVCQLRISVGYVIES